MPTIYDILPSLEKKLIELLGDLVKANDGKLYSWEAVITYPATNAFLHFLQGVNVSLQNDNYFSAMANLRGLIEALGAVAYDGIAKLPNGAYDEFITKGRLPKWNEKKKKWNKLDIQESVEYAQKVVSKKIDLLSVYAECCNIVHFSATHMSFLGGFEPKIDEKGRTVRFAIGAKDNIPVKLQREMIDLCAELTTALGWCINAGIEEKTNRHTPRPA